MPDTLKHLLLVEDEAPLRQAIAEQLGDRGYHVEQADSGEAALAHLADFAFDIIITDLRLPGVDGSAVVEAGRCWLGCAPPTHPSLANGSTMANPGTWYRRSAIRSRLELTLTG